MENRIKELKKIIFDTEAAIIDPMVNDDKELVELLKDELKVVKNNLVELEKDALCIKELRGLITDGEKALKVLQMTKSDELESALSCDLAKHKITLSILQNKYILKDRIQFLNSWVIKIETKQAKVSGANFDSEVEASLRHEESKKNIKNEMRNLNVVVDNLNEILKALD